MLKERGVFVVSLRNTLDAMSQRRWATVGAGALPFRCPSLRRFPLAVFFFFLFFLHFGIVFSSLLSFFFFFFFGSWKKQSVSSRDKSQIALLECNYYLEYDSTNVLIEVSRNVDMSFAGIWKQLRSNSVEHRRTDSPVDDSENQNAVDIQTEMAAKRWIINDPISTIFNFHFRL